MIVLLLLSVFYALTRGYGFGLRVITTFLDALAPRHLSFADQHLWSAFHVVPSMPPKKKHRPNPPDAVAGTSAAPPTPTQLPPRLPDIEDCVPGRFSNMAIVDIREKLLQWYAVRRRNLPWREPGTSAYGTWVSEVMLQQTRVATVVEYWQRWMQTFPTVQDLAAAPLEKVNELWSGLGYYRRAASLHKGAQKVMPFPYSPACWQPYVRSCAARRKGVVSLELVPFSLGQLV